MSRLFLLRLGHFIDTVPQIEGVGLLVLKQPRWGDCYSAAWGSAFAGLRRDEKVALPYCLLSLIV
tara:strand:+ start:956 stop:1150 length:195 start_codon:yes stop_codon:yes gene_type:complete